MLVLSVAAVYSADKESGADIDGQVVRIGRAIAAACTNAFSHSGFGLGDATAVQTTDYNAFSNILFSSIETTSSNFALGISWAAQAGSQETLDVYSKTNLTEASWSHLAEVDVNVAAESVLAAIPFDWLGYPSSAFFRVGTRLDTDCDGLPDSFELLASLTNPTQPDSDGDGMNDGWEIAHAALGYDPLSANTNGLLAASSDLDFDGISNYQEAQIGTNPGLPDTDGDGCTDGLEVLLGSDPLNASSNMASNTNVAVAFAYGDPSYTKSEKYSLAITPVDGSGPGQAPRAFSWVNGQYGQCDTNVAFLARGWRYSVRLRHAGTNRSPDDGPDYDYVLAYSNLSASAKFFFEDPDDLFGLVDVRDGGPFTAEGKVAFMSILDMVVTKDAEILKKDDFAYITAEPQMPDLKVAFYPCGLTGTGTINLSIDYARHQVSQHSEFTSGVIATGSEWGIRSAMGEAIRGGRAVFSGECLDNTFSQTNHIRGTNPSAEDVEAAIGDDPWYAKAIIRHESGHQGNFRYCQFNEVGNLGPDFTDIRHSPNWGTPNGWGIGQIDPPASDDTLWNWRTNILEVIDKMTKFRTEAANWISRQQTQQEAEAPSMSLSNETFVIAGYVFSDGSSRTPIDACAIARYNGLSHWPIYWRNTTPIIPGSWCIHPEKTNYIWRVMNELDE